MRFEEAQACINWSHPGMIVFAQLPELESVAPEVALVATVAAALATMFLALMSYVIGAKLTQLRKGRHASGHRH